ncbi:MAG: HD domain-containing protein [Clostridiales bacterium]|jgi:3'-5' exoribonuclease|nr:HD domain-containing protein [Clostridiales bacterium]
MRYIADLKEDERVTEHYFCKQKQSLKSRAGKTYLSLKLQDKTGVIDAKVWDLTNEIQSFEEHDYIKINGIALTYQNEIQLKINRVRKSEPNEIDPLDYVPSTDKNIDALYDAIVEYIRSIEDPFIREMMELILVEDKTAAEAFKRRSAAKSLHHGYMGGLIEHTLNVTQICDFMSGRYKFVNRDILIAGAILHDIGKIYELSDFPENDYTDDGQLMGHLIIGADIIEKTANRIEGFPNDVKTLLRHCVLAHHGEYEYGSPKLPKTIEAFILYCCDNADAKIKMFEETIENDRSQGVWSQYHRMLERNIRKP